MPISKPTTAADIKVEEDAVPPTLEAQLAGTEENTAPEMVADVNRPKTVRLKSPAGFVTDVPEGIVDALKESGYKASK